MRGRLNFRLCSRCWASDQSSLHCFLFFFNDTATTEIYTLSLHDALPISQRFEEGGWIAILRLEQPAMHQLARATLTRGRTHDACEACLVVAVWNQNDLVCIRLAVSRLIQLYRARCHAYYFCRVGRNQPLHPAVRTP